MKKSRWLIVAWLAELVLVVGALLFLLSLPQLSEFKAANPRGGAAHAFPWYVAGAIACTVGAVFVGVQLARSSPTQS
jgi:hypothetical protein